MLMIYISVTEMTDDINKVILITDDSRMGVCWPKWKLASQVCLGIIKMLLHVLVVTAFFPVFLRIW